LDKHLVERCRLVEERKMISLWDDVKLCVGHHALGCFYMGQRKEALFLTPYD
jgi:hypothetical protein